MNEFIREQNLNKFKFKFNKEQRKILRNIQDVDDLIKIFKKIIYISNCSYVDLLFEMQSKFDDMLDDMLK